jgi:NCS1 family nucleobase:cation symporter-1
VPSLIRAVVACGWFGIQTLFGGIAIHLMFSAMSDSWAALGGVGEVLGFFIFWVANLAVVIRGSESIKLLEALAAPLLLIVAIGLVVWALPKISLSEVLSTPATRPKGAPFFGYFMAGLTAMVGFLATLSLNIPDFSRYARTQRSQVIGQIIGLPLTMLLFAGLGVVLTAASVELTGEIISDPINLIGPDQPDWSHRQRLLGRDCDAHDHPRNDLYQHGCEYRIANQRVPERRPENNQRRSRRVDHRFHRHCTHELGAAEKNGLARHRRQR